MIAPGVISMPNSWPSPRRNHDDDRPGHDTVTKESVAETAHPSLTKACR
jgi:hypothetical protein